jgi:hypothetical protein
MQEFGTMARIVGRRRIREGRGLGERLTEIVVYVVLIAGAIYGVRWYFTEYLQSPKVALGRYLGLVKSGDVKAQYEMLSSSAKRFFPSVAVYENKWPPARGLAGRLASWQIEPVSQKDDRAEVKAVLNIRKTGQALYEAASDPYTDRYVMVKEKDGWKVALDKSDLASTPAAKGTRQ